MARIPLTGTAQSGRGGSTPQRLASRPPLPARQRYYLLDKNVTELVVGNKNIRVQDEHRADGIEMTDKEAAFYIASGTVGTQKPTEQEAPPAEGEDEEGGKRRRR